MMSPAMLSRRLKMLQDCGIVVRIRSEDRRSYEYRVTDAGMQLKPLLLLAGEWGQRWARSTLQASELHPSVLMWDLQRFLKVEHLPRRRTVIYIEFRNLRKNLKRLKSWWLVVEHGKTSVKRQAPTHSPDVAIYSDLCILTRVFMGELTLKQAESSDQIKLEGNSRLIKSMPRWMAVMPFAGVKPGIPTQPCLE